MRPDLIAEWSLLQAEPVEGSALDRVWLFRERARQLRLRAQQAGNPRMKETYEALALAWDNLAEGLEHRHH